MRMKKTDAIELFGTPKATADAIGVRVQAIYQWPDELTDVLTDRVVAAAYRAGLSLDGVAFFDTKESA